MCSDSISSCSSCITACVLTVCVCVCLCVCRSSPALCRGPRTLQARTVIQQCSQAKVKIKPALDGAEAQWAEVGSSVPFLLTSLPRLNKLSRNLFVQFCNKPTNRKQMDGGWKRRLRGGDRKNRNNKDAQVGINRSLNRNHLKDAMITYTLGHVSDFTSRPQIQEGMVVYVCFSRGATENVTYEIGEMLFHVCQIGSSFKCRMINISKARD